MTACSDLLWLQVSIVSFKKGQLQVLAHSWDRNLGGRDFDNVLFEHFVKEFNQKYKIDIKSNMRAAFRLRVACEKVPLPSRMRCCACLRCGSTHLQCTLTCLRQQQSGGKPSRALLQCCQSACDAIFLQLKKVLSANAEATINVESLMEDIDVSGRMSRDVFEQLAEPLAARVPATLQKVEGLPDPCKVLSG